MEARPLAESVQLTYAQLLDALMDASLPTRGITLVCRTVKGRKYWYMQVVIGEHRRAYYLGADDDPMRARIEAFKARKQADAPSQEVRARLVEMLRAGGATMLPASHGRVLEALAQAGVFLAGGVLVGSHAFALMGNALGVRWSEGSLRTADVDLAHDETVSAVVPGGAIDLEQVLRDTGQPFFPVPALRHDHPSTSFKIRGAELSVSLLTPMRGKPDSAPRPIPALSAMAEPLRFLDYLLEDTQQVAAPVRHGFLVTTPSPGRFALHKLVVSTRRPPTFAIKARKDRAQARQILELLVDERPGDLSLALEAARDMPRRFRQQLIEASTHLPDPLRDTVEQGLQDPT